MIQEDGGTLLPLKRHEVSADLNFVLEFIPGRITEYHDRHQAPPLDVKNLLHALNIPLTPFA